MKYFRLIHLAWIALIVVFLYQGDLSSVAYMLMCVAATEVSGLIILIAYSYGKDDKPE